MSAWQDGIRLRVYVEESDHHHGVPVYEWVVAKARERHLPGATVVRGMEGFGARSHLHTAHILALSDNLPVVVEVVGPVETVEPFALFLEGELTNGMMTQEPVRFRSCHKAE